MSVQTKLLVVIGTPILVAVLSGARVVAQSVVTVVPKFEVASIRPCHEPPQKAGGGGMRGADSSPGRLRIGCAPLIDLINDAYVGFADGHLNIESTPIHGGPPWLHSTFYQISATAEGAPSVGMMMGPMLQELLQDRFRLKVHRQIEEGQVYFLTAARGGAKLHSFTEGSCTPYTTFPRPALQPGQEYCASMIGAGSPASLDDQGATLDDFSKQLQNVSDRPVINKAGISGRFNIHVDFSREGMKLAGVPLLPPIDGESPAADASGAPSIFTALREQLGLKLEPGEGSVEVLVIDYVERPSEN